MAIKDKRTGLTPRQECFAINLLTAPSASAAYRIAYPTSETWTIASVNVQASKMQLNPNIILRVQSIRDRIARKQDVTQESLIRELEEARQMAIEERQSAAMTGASMGKARLMGLDKVIIAGDKDEPITLIKRVIVDRVIDEKVVESIASDS